MTDQNPAAVPQWMKDEANPDCPKCINLLSRSQKRWQERNEAIRQVERSEARLKDSEFDLKNYAIWAERNVDRLEKQAAANKIALEQAAAANRAAVEGTISLEEHNAKS